MLWYSSKILLSREKVTCKGKPLTKIHLSPKVTIVRCKYLVIYSRLSISRTPVIQFNSGLNSGAWGRISIVNLSITGIMHN